MVQTVKGDYLKQAVAGRATILIKKRKTRKANTLTSSNNMNRDACRSERPGSGAGQRWEGHGGRGQKSPPPELGVPDLPVW